MKKILTFISCLLALSANAQKPKLLVFVGAGKCGQVSSGTTSFTTRVGTTSTTTTVTATPKGSDIYMAVDLLFAQKNRMSFNLGLELQNFGMDIVAESRTVNRVTKASSVSGPTYFSIIPGASIYAKGKHLTAIPMVGVGIHASASQGVKTVIGVTGSLSVGYKGVYLHGGFHVSSGQIYSESIENSAPRVRLALFNVGLKLSPQVILGHY